MPASHLACILVFVLMATSCAQTPTTPLLNIAKPNPEPALPQGCDPFTPPLIGVTPAPGATALAEWTRTGGPDSVIVMTGSRLASSSVAGVAVQTQFEVFAENATGTFTGQAQLLGLNGMTAAIVLPLGVPANSECLIWPMNGAGPGTPATINATEAWWIGPNAATRGDTVSVYGRNLTQNAMPKASHIYIQKQGATGLWASVTAANPYKVDFTVPGGLADGDYQVWVHNGRGGHYGWSGPLTLTINDGQPWSQKIYNVKAYGALGDGVTDDQAAIEAAVEAAQKDPWSTIYLPAGTYMVSRGFTPPCKVRWLGDGPTQTFIKANSGFVKPATWDARAYCLLFTNSGYDNIAVQNLTLDANGNLNGYLATPVYLRFDTDVRFTNVTINAKGYGTADLDGCTRLSFHNCDLIGGGNGVFFGAAKQIVMDGCRVYGTNDVNTMLTSWGGDSTSVTNTTGEDYDNTTSDGWAQGRFIYGSAAWGCNRNIYVGDCTTKALAPRPAFPNQNTGEQVAWEDGTRYSGAPLSATATTVTFGSAPIFTDSTLQGGGDDAVIVNGTGLGQHRKIVACTGTTITVCPAWNVPPDTTSTVIFAGDVSRCVVYHNTLQGKSTYATQVTASTAIQPYGNSFDFVADSNTISDVRGGISLWGMAEDTLTPKSISCAYFNYVANNSISNCLNGLNTVSQAWQGWPAADAYPGISCLANVCTNNQVSNAANNGITLQAQTAPIGLQIDFSIYDHNTVSQTPVGINSNSPLHIANTFLYRNGILVAQTSAAPRTKR